MRSDCFALVREAEAIIVRLTAEESSAWGTTVAADADVGESLLTVLSMDTATAHHPYQGPSAFLSMDNTSHDDFNFFLQPPPATVVPYPTLLELVSTDRSGLLSEVFAVLHYLRCDIVNAKAWTHSGHVTTLVFVRDEEMDAPIDDAVRVRRVESRLRRVLRSCTRGARTVLTSVINMDRRLHQLLNEDGEEEAGGCAGWRWTTACCWRRWSCCPTTCPQGLLDRQGKQRDDCHGNRE
jgi:hypothetical protein